MQRSKLRNKCKVTRRSEQYAEIKALKRQLFALSKSAVEVQEKDLQEEQISQNL
jgi:hypothetical protein